MLSASRKDAALLAFATLVSQGSAVAMGAMKPVAAVPRAALSLPEIQPTPVRDGDFVRRQGFEVPETTANPNNPTLQGFVDGDPNQPQRCGLGSTAFLQSSGGFACCSGNCGSYTAPVTCVPGGSYTGAHTFGLTTNCANPASAMCNSYLYNYPDGMYTFAFCSNNDSPTTINVLFATTTSTTTSSQPFTTSTPTPTTTSSQPQTTSSSSSSPPNTTTSSSTSSAPSTSSSPSSSSTSTSSSQTPIVGPVPTESDPSNPANTGPAGQSSSSPSPSSGGGAPVSSGSKTNTGAIAGGVVGGVAALAILGGLLFFFLNRRRKRAAMTPKPYDPYNPPRANFSPEHFGSAESPPLAGQDYPRADAPPTIPVVASSPPLGSTLSEKFAGLQDSQPQSGAQPTVHGGNLATAGAGGQGNAPVSSELQGTEVYEMPVTAAKAMPNPGTEYHELDTSRG